MDGNTVVDCAFSVDERGIERASFAPTKRSPGERAIGGEALRVTASLLASPRPGGMEKSTGPALSIETGGMERIVPGDDGQSVIAEFIRTKGITRCPTACVVATQGSVSAADRAALEEYATARDRVRREKSLRARLFWTVETRRPADK